MWYNPLIIGLLRSPLHVVMSASMLVITYTGRKSSKQHQVPVNFARRGDTLLVTSHRERMWWRNFRGGAVVSVRLAGVEREAFAEVLEEESAVAAGLALYLGGKPQVAQFFGITSDKDGNLDPEELARAATERVIVKLKLTALV